MARPFVPIKISMGSKSGYISAADSMATLRKQLNILQQNFRDLAKHMNVETPEVLMDALRPTFEKSQRIVPVDTGDLKESGYLEYVASKGGVQVEMGYAYRGNPHYAVYVHETPMNHKSPTQWKFLQQPLEEDARNIEQAITKSLATAAGVA